MKTICLPTSVEHPLARSRGLCSRLYREVRVTVAPLGLTRVGAQSASIYSAISFVSYCADTMCWPRM